MGVSFAEISIIRDGKIKTYDSMSEFFSDKDNIEIFENMNFDFDIEVPDVPDIPDIPDLPDLPDIPDIPDIPASEAITGTYTSGDTYFYQIKDISKFKTLTLNAFSTDIEIFSVESDVLNLYTSQDKAPKYLDEYIRNTIEKKFNITITTDENGTQSVVTVVDKEEKKEYEKQLKELKKQYTNLKAQLKKEVSRYKAEIKKSKGHENDLIEDLHEMVEELSEEMEELSEEMRELYEEMEENDLYAPKQYTVLTDDGSSSIKISDKGISVTQGTSDSNKPFKVIKRGKEIKIEFDKSYNDVIRVGIPENLSLNIEVVDGTVDIKDIKSEVNLNGKSIELFAENMEGVFTVYNKNGNLDFRDFNGVLKVSNLIGNVTLTSGEGKILSKVLSGNVSISEYVGKIDVESKVGNIRMKDLKSCDVNIKVQGGDIELKDLDSCNEVSIENSAGDILIGDSEAKRFKVQNQSGDIVLKDISGIYKVSVVNGDIALSVDKLDLSNENYISTDYGDINLRLKNKDDYKYFGSSGKVELSYKNLDGVRGIRIKNKNGKGNSFYLGVNYGEIRID